MTIEEFCDGVVHALNRWLLEHTDRMTWTNAWLMNGDVRIVFENYGGVIQTDFMYFDWRQAALRRFAESFNGWCRCPECGITDTELVCNCDVEEGIDLSNEEVMDYLYYLDCVIPDYILEVAFMQDGFDAYVESTHPHIESIIEYIQEALEKIGNARDNWGYLNAVVAACGIHHYSGNVVRDYGYLDYRIISSVRNDGLESVFDRDDIREFVSEEVYEQAG